MRGQDRAFRKAARCLHEICRCLNLCQFDRPFCLWMERYGGRFRRVCYDYADGNTGSAEFHRCLSNITRGRATDGDYGPVSRGLDAFNARNYDNAYALWITPALQGDPAAYNNIGLLFENGSSANTPRSDAEAARWYSLAAQQGLLVAMRNLARVQIRNGQQEAAISWLTFAARWNDQEAVAELTRLQRPVPAPDLALQHQQAMAQQQQILALQRQQQNAAILQSLGFALGCAVAGGCQPPTVPVAPTTSTSPRRPLECRATPQIINGFPRLECR